MPESKYWIKPASWRLTDLACRPARSDSSRLRCSLAISRLPSRSSTKSYCREEQRGAWQVMGWAMAPPASPQHPDNMLVFWPRVSFRSREAGGETNAWLFLCPLQRLQTNLPTSPHAYYSGFFGDKWPMNLLHILGGGKTISWIESVVTTVTRWELTSKVC